MLEAAGYDKHQAAALRRVSKSQGVPESTLRSWWNRLSGNGNEPNRGAIPANLYTEKKKSLREMFQDEIKAILAEMPNARDQAHYRDLGWVLGVMFDKIQLLDDKPTGIVKLKQALESGDIDPEAVRARYPSLASELFANVDH